MVYNGSPKLLKRKFSTIFHELDCDPYNIKESFQTKTCVFNSSEFFLLVYSPSILTDIPSNMMVGRRSFPFYIYKWSLFG